MPALTTMPFTTGNINADQKVRDFAPSVAFLAPRIAQILFLAARIAPAPFQQAFGIKEEGATNLSLNIRTVTNFKYEWLEDTLKATTTQINQVANYLSTDLALIVDDASIFTIHDIVDVVSTGEILMVTNVNVSTNTITVTRAWGSTAAAAIADNAYLLIVGNAFSEAASYQLSSQTITTTKFNYIQDTRHAFAGTYVLDHHELYGGDQRSYLRNKFLVDHQRYLEASILFSEGKDGTAGTSDASPKKSTKGLLEVLTSNVLAVGGVLTKATFNNWLKDLFTYGSNEKVLFCSPTIAAAISNFAGDMTSTPVSQLFVMNNARAFGLNVMTYGTKFGTLHIVMHGMFTGNTYSGYGIAVDPAYLKLAKVKGGFFMNLREDILMDGAHRWVDEYATYFGVQYQNIETGGVLTGVTG